MIPVFYHLPLQIIWTELSIMASILPKNCGKT